MLDSAMDATYCLRVMVNKEKTKVLFAEADSDFISILLSFLALPLGRIQKLLENHYGDKAPAFGSITSLYKGLSNLDDVYFSSNVAKLMLLNPPSSCDVSIFSKLKLNVFKHPSKYFVCDKSECKCITMYYGGAVTCDCGRPMSIEKTVPDSESAEEVPFTIKTASFIISDDFKLVPNSAGFLQTLINTFGLTVTEGAELSNMILGNNEIMDLLSCCLLSKTPLTDFVLNKGQISISSATELTPGIFLHQIENEEPTNSKNIVLKVMVHKSTNKVLFAEADDDFIELLFSFLLIPIGGIESLLGNKTCLKNLDNLYRSISDVDLDKYFMSLDTKKRLINPNIPHSSKSENTFYPFKYESAPEVHYSWVHSTNPALGHPHTLPTRLISHKPMSNSSLFTFKSPVGKSYVKQPTTYLVTDDLTVTPFHISSVFSILNKMNIPLSDVDKLEVHIGLQEALSILKASLTSDSALTNGLFNRLMKKQPKQEPCSRKQEMSNSTCTLGSSKFRANCDGCKRRFEYPGMCMGLLVKCPNCKKTFRAIKRLAPRGF